LLLDGLEGRDFAGCTICAEKVPGVESGKVLEGSEELITAYCCCNEFEVVGHRGVVNEGVGDHFDVDVMMLQVWGSEVVLEFC
jgi:hypothetical protein